MQMDVYDKIKKMNDKADNDFADINNLIARGNFTDAKAMLNKMENNVRTLRAANPENTPQYNAFDKQFIAMADEIQKKRNLLNQAEKEHGKKEQEEIHDITEQGQTELEELKKRVEARKRKFNEDGNVNSFNIFINELARSYQQRYNSLQYDKKSPVKNVKLLAYRDMNEYMQTELSHWNAIYKHIYMKLPLEAITKEIKK